MDGRLTVPVLKRTLLHEVRSFFRRDGSVWKEPILHVLQDIRDSKLQAVLFGGTLRSLLVSRIYQDQPGRPRDLDIVVSGASLAQLEEQFADILTRVEHASVDCNCSMALGGSMYGHLTKLGPSSSIAEARPLNLPRCRQQRPSIWKRSPLRCGHTMGGHERSSPATINSSRGSYPEPSN